MAKGGKRPGAGRPKGAKTILSEQAFMRAIQSGDGKLPLDFLLETMRDPTHEFSTRLDAAKAAAPYLHARKQEIDHRGEITRRVVSEPVSPEEWLKQVEMRRSSLQ